MSKRAQMIGATCGRLAPQRQLSHAIGPCFSNTVAVAMPDVFAFGVLNALLESVNSIPVESSAIVQRPSGAHMELASSG